MKISKKVQNSELLVKREEIQNNEEKWTNIFKHKKVKKTNLHKHESNAQFESKRNYEAKRQNMQEEKRH